MPIDVISPAEWPFKAIPQEDLATTHQYELPPVPPQESAAQRHARELLGTIRTLQQFMELAYVNDYREPHTMGDMLAGMLAKAAQQAERLGDVL